MGFPTQPHVNSTSPLYIQDSSIDVRRGTVIEPELGSSKPPHTMETWNPRLWSEHDKTIHFDYHQLDPFAHNSFRQPDGISPFPIPRQESPADHSSFICNSSLSPHGENDYGIDYLPTTPPHDASMFGHYEGSSQYNQQFQLTGLTDFFVKLGEVALFQESFQVHVEEQSPKFPTRGLSMSSNGSSFDIGSTSHPEKSLNARQMSPAELPQTIEDEICIPEPNSNNSYPPIESGGDQSTSEDELAVLDPTTDKDEEDDYKPNSQYKRTNSNANRANKGRKRPSNSASTPSKRRRLEPNSTPKRVSPKHSFQALKPNYHCEECRDAAFMDENGLQKHVKQQHTRPFVCVFRFAGCESTFASKNEWKRHVASQHLLLTYWLCQQDGCKKFNNSSPASKSTSPSRNRRSPHLQNGQSILPHGSIFNRKDLYTQHLRRMHTPPAIRKQVKQRKTVPEWEERIREHQEEAHKTRCDLPEYMTCPAVGCNARFDGGNAWDERMEHVAKHLETSDSIAFGGEHDPTLTDWAARADVAVVRQDEKGKWRLNNLLKPDKNAKAHVGLSEEDADGEEVEDF